MIFACSDLVFHVKTNKLLIVVLTFLISLISSVGIGIFPNWSKWIDFETSKG